MCAMNGYDIVSRRQNNNFTATLTHQKIKNVFPYELVDCTFPMQNWNNERNEYTSNYS